MPKGKRTCKILKEIRKQIAEENDINLVIEECTYQGDCAGTCPRCEAEVRYLEQELEKRQRMGKAVMISGLAVTTMLGVSACNDWGKAVGIVPDDRLEGEPVELPLAGDVARVVDTNIILDEPVIPDDDPIALPGEPVEQPLMPDTLPAEPASPEELNEVPEKEPLMGYVKPAPDSPKACKPKN